MSCQRNHSRDSALAAQDRMPVRPIPLIKGPRSSTQFLLPLQQPDHSLLSYPELIWTARQNQRNVVWHRRCNYYTKLYGQSSILSHEYGVVSRQRLWQPPHRMYGLRCYSCLVSKCFRNLPHSVPILLHWDVQNSRPSRM